MPLMKRPKLRVLSRLAVVSTILAVVLAVVGLRPAAALQLAPRSLAIASSTGGATTRHTFQFEYASINPVGSVLFEYCTSPLEQLPCNAPSGLDASVAALSSQTGEAGFSVAGSSANTITLTRAATAPSTPSAYAFEGIVNPSAVGSFYVRIFTYQTEDATGSYTDFGAVVNRITQGVSLSTEVPPILIFCVGVNIADDCSSASGNLVELGTLTPSGTARATSQLLAATNALFGVAISAYGTTLTSGNHLIPAPALPTPSASGNSQFGINLRANSDPPIGQEPIGIGAAQPASAYNIPNRYMFKNADVVATSTAATDFRKFTVSYIANVSPAQSPGTYTATITYLCTATF